MTEMPSSTSHTEGASQPPPGVADELRVLRRSRMNRVVAGVLGGLGHRLGVDPLVLRVVTAVLALFGGVGVLLYALAWLLVPAEDEPASVLDQAIGRRDVRDAAAVPLALGLGALVLISTGVMLGSWSAWMLLILAGVGMLTLLRRQSDPGASRSAPAGSGYDGQGGAAYAPWSAVSTGYESRPGSWSATGTSDDTGATPVYGSAGAPTDDTHDAPTDDAPGAPTDDTPAASSDDEAARTPEASDDTDPYETRDVPAATAPTGATAGWPEGPDWGTPVTTDRSPYDDLYLQRETGKEPLHTEDKRPRSALGWATFSAALVAVGAVALADALGAGEPGPLYIGVPLAVVAAGLLIGTWYGRSRGMIILGVLLSLALVPATAISHWDMTTGPNEVPPPTSVAELPSEPLTHGVGPVSYDLSQLELTGNDDVAVTMQLGMGTMEITVPENADVVASADVGAGEIHLFGSTTSGFGRSREVSDLGADGPGGGRMELKLELGMGSVEVTRATTDPDDPADPARLEEPAGPEEPDTAPEVAR